jgi:predicted O-methyltransferase YrrM
MTIHFNLRAFIKAITPYGIVNYYKSHYPDRNSPAHPNIPLLLPEIELEQLFPSINTERICFTVSEIVRPPEMGIPLEELLTLIAICQYRHPQSIFEVGTYQGNTTLNLAMISSEITDVYTLDLSDDERISFSINQQYLVGEKFRQTNTLSKITQLFGNSLSYNFSEYYNSVDLVFIDANHTYEYVKSDTENALKMLKPNGIIIWDDYVWDDRHPECSGVAQYLNELNFKIPCYHILGTRLAIYWDR